MSRALVEVRPTFAAAVPRFFEKLYGTVRERGAQATGLRRHLFDWAVRTARRAIPWRAYGRPVSPIVELQWELADRLVYRNFAPAWADACGFLFPEAPRWLTELAEFFTHRRHHHFSRLRSHRDLARDQQQHRRAESHRHRRPSLAGH